MRLVAFVRRGAEEAVDRAGGVGVLTDDGIYDLTRAALYWNADPDRPLTRSLSRDVSLLVNAGPQRLLGALDLLSGTTGADEVETSFPLIPVDSVAVRAPLLHPGKIIGVGLNYRDHCREQGVFPPAHPILFAKFNNALTDPGAPIAHPDWTEQLDFECELAVVIGSKARRVGVDRALEHVFGYTILNDVTARDAQKTDRQWLRAKGADGFAPLGPVVVTADEVADPQSLGIGSTVNGEIWQYSSTAEMIFSVAELISFISQSITLEPGDVIATGTPAGVGHFHTPPRYLQVGDVVRCEIEGIGVLENEIVEPAALLVAEEVPAVPVAPAAPVTAAQTETPESREAPPEQPVPVAPDAAESVTGPVASEEAAVPGVGDTAALHVGQEPSEPSAAFGDGVPDESRQPTAGSATGESGPAEPTQEERTEQTGVPS